MVQEGEQPADRLRLRVSGGGKHDGKEVHILLNGWRQLARVANRAYQGFHPAQLLDPDNSPLRPAAPAARIALYQCCCGHTGCGCVAPIIARAGDQVTWSDFRGFTGCYDGPVAERAPSADAGEPLQLPDFAFDAGQYLAEVDRVIADRWWETPPLLTARLLRGHLDREQQRLGELGWRRQYLWPSSDPDQFRLTLTDGQDHQIWLDLTARPGSSSDQARELAELVLTTSPLSWPVKGCSFCEYGFEPSPGYSKTDHEAALAAHPAHALPGNT